MWLEIASSFMNVIMHYSFLIVEYKSCRVLRQPRYLIDKWTLEYDINLCKYGEGYKNHLRKVDNI